MTNCIEINIVNNTKLRANAQYILALMCAIRLKNMSLIYNPKQKKFKVMPPLLKALWLIANILSSFRPSINKSSTIIVILL